jgi:hypothetical protein
MTLKLAGGARNRQSGEAIILQKAVVDIATKRIRQSLQDFFKRTPKRLAQPARSHKIAMDDT